MNIRRLAARGFHAILRNNIAAAKILGVTFGKNCKFIGNPLELFGSEPWAIHIGDHVELTNGVQIITHDGALWVARSLDKTLERADIIQKVTIGNNVFVGTNTTILGGVTIGDNVIIGAGSVVNKDIPSGFVAVGVPAKPIKTVEAYLADKRDSVLDTKGMSSRQKQQIWSKVF